MVLIMSSEHHHPPVLRFFAAAAGAAGMPGIQAGTQTAIASQHMGQCQNRI